MSHRSDPVSSVDIHERREHMVFTYRIVPAGGNARQAMLVRALSAANLEKAKQYVQTVAAPEVAGNVDLEVIVEDDKGVELWRGPYLGKR